MELDEADKFETVKPRFLHNTFVMYELQYGVNLNSFTETIDPIASF